MTIMIMMVMVLMVMIIDAYINAEENDAWERKVVLYVDGIWTLIPIYAC